MSLDMGWLFIVHFIQFECGHLRQDAQRAEYIMRDFVHLARVTVIREIFVIAYSYE